MTELEPLHREHSPLLRCHCASLKGRDAVRGIGNKGLNKVFSKVSRTKLKRPKPKIGLFMRLYWVAAIARRYLLCLKQSTHCGPLILIESLDGLLRFARKNW